MQAYILYAAIFISVILLFEGSWLIIRSRISNDALVNRRIKLIKKTGDNDIGLSLLRAHRKRRMGNQLMAKLDSLIWAANLRLNPFSLVFFMLIFGALCLLILSLLGLGTLPRILLTLFAALLPLAIVLRRAQKRRKLFNEQLIPAVDLISRGLQAGHPAAVALEIVATEMPDPIGTEFGLAIDEIRYGLDRTVALRNLGKRFPSPDMHFFTAALEVQRETGGNLVEVLNNLTKMMRDRKAMAMKVKAMSAEGRVTGWIVGLLPLVIFLVINLMMPTYYSDHTDDIVFFQIMAFPIAFYIAGVIWMKRLVSIRI